MFREDRQQSMEIPYTVFKTVYKRLGIKTNINDEKELFNYWSMGSSNPQNTINLRMLNKLVEVLAKRFYKLK